jgi:hypothetical protein
MSSIDCNQISRLEGCYYFFDFLALWWMTRV